MAFVVPPSTDWPYGVVSLDKAYWNVFITRTPRDEWGVVIERGTPQGPEGLKNALARRFAPGGAGKRPVKVFLDMTCPPDERQVFLDAARTVTDPAGVALEDEPLPDRDDFETLRRKRYEAQLAPYRDTLEFGVLAHLASAAALALVVWWTPKTVRGGALVSGGNLLLAFGQAVALPIALYVAVMPDGLGTPDFKRLSLHLQPHLWIVYASSAGLIAGVLATTLGHLLVPKDPTPSPSRVAKAAEAAPRPEAPPSPSS